MDQTFSYENLRATDSAHDNDAPSSSLQKRNPSKLLPGIFKRKEKEVLTTGDFATEAILGMGLKQKELFLLKSAFDELDEDRSGKISRNEFLQAIGETDDPGRLNRVFLDKVFCMSDLDRDGLMDFDEFIVLSATFLMFAHRDMVRFVFGCYNKRGHGLFGEIDFMELSHHNNVVLAKPQKKDWSDILKFDKEYKGCLSETEFIVMAHEYPQIIYFASRVQAKMQDYCLGYAWYIKLLKRQERARMLEEYKNTHGGTYVVEPPEKVRFVSIKWIQQQFAFLTGYDDYDVRIQDNTHLLNIGMNMYMKQMHHNFSEGKSRTYSSHPISSMKVRKSLTSSTSPTGSRKLSPLPAPQKPSSAQNSKKIAVND